MGAEGVRRGDWQFKEAGLRRFFGHFSSWDSSSSFGIPHHPFPWYVHLFPILLVDGLHGSSLSPCISVFWRTCTFHNLFTVPLAGLGGCWTCTISRSASAICSLSPSCYYLIDRLLLQLVVRGLLDGSDITGVHMSASRTPASDIDRLFGNGSRSKTLPASTDNLFLSTPPAAITNPLHMLICNPCAPRGLFPFPFFARNLRGILGRPWKAGIYSVPAFRCQIGSCYDGALGIPTPRLGESGYTRPAGVHYLRISSRWRPGFVSNGPCRWLLTGHFTLGSGVDVWGRNGTEG